jgi:hypothetical protein
VDGGNTAPTSWHDWPSAFAYCRLCKVALFLVIPNVKQCFAIKFLLKQEVKLAEIVHRLSARYGEVTL